MNARLQALNRLLAVAALAATGGLACDGDSATSADGWEWDLPEGFPTPAVPDDNPMNTAKVELGRRLFYDTRLSGNQTQACASCHLQANAFAEPLATSVGSTGDVLVRNAMSLTNVVYNSRQTWSNPALVHLEQQALVPMFGEDPVELGLAGLDAELVSRLAADDAYPPLFGDAFPEDDGAITVGAVTKAIAAFQRTLISGNSPYDRFWYGKDARALTTSAQRGLAMFLSERLECFHCHGGFNFADSTTHEQTTFDEIAYHNTGLYNLDADGSYPPTDRGLYDVTGEARDMGAFKAPTLRNIALTAPYMHDGSVTTLDAVLDHYTAGGRTIEAGDRAGVGADNPHKNAFIKGFVLSDSERADVMSFLESLTDTTFTSDPRFSDPFAPPASP